MAFKQQTANIDFGCTSIENIFINDFMAMASGTYVKVYLLGYKVACDNEEGLSFNNSKIARHLSIPLEDVLAAWDFWEKRGVIQKLHNEDPFNYDVEFISLRQLYIDNNYRPAADAKAPVGPTDLIEANRSEVVRQMFRDCEGFIRRALQPNEMREILSHIYDHATDPAFVVKAFEYAAEVKDVLSPKYALGILRNWRDEGIMSYEALEQKLNEEPGRRPVYRKIYKHMGYSHKNVSAGDKELMDRWLDDMKLDEAFILEVIRENSSKTSNLNMNYIDAILKRLAESGVHNLETLSTYRDERLAENETAQTKTASTPTKQAPRAKTQDKPVRQNRFNDFNLNKNKYSNDELEKILGIKKK